MSPQQLENRNIWVMAVLLSSFSLLIEQEPSKEGPTSHLSNQQYGVAPFQCGEAKNRKDGEVVVWCEPVAGKLQNDIISDLGPDQQQRDTVTWKGITNNTRTGLFRTAYREDLVSH